DLNAIVAGVRDGQGTVGKLLTDDEFYASLKNLAAEAEKTMANLREASVQAKGAIADFRGDGGPMKGVTGDLQQTLTSAKDAMADLAENTEALKRSFFFRGFFNSRGYFDLQDVTLRQYREGVLETGDRHALRIWVGTPVLFEAAGDGRERISEAGRRRIDSAMSTFVKYPENSPLVVEGYAKQRATSQARFLLSRSRAELVRDYIVGKYRRDGNHLAIMPMGAEAVDSPSGAQWDGVALAMFVSSSAL
ncbi:MAG: hypothetical protein M3Q85_12435, partial [Acidobacteriota bacterium]|nr:hypothetical protein [Acidobacteriota bacterium]